MDESMAKPSLVIFLNLKAGGFGCAVRRTRCLLVQLREAVLR